MEGSARVLRSRSLNGQANNNYVKVENMNSVEAKLEQLFFKQEVLDNEVVMEALVEENKNQEQLDYEIEEVDMDADEVEEITEIEEIDEEDVDDDEDDDEELHLPPGFEAEERNDEPDYGEKAYGKKTGKNFYCKICSLQFSNNKYLVEHRKVVHTGEMPYSCVHCSKCFEDLDSLTAHIRQHEGKLPYCCKICKQEFELLSDYDKHKPIHILKKVEYKSRRVFACDTCYKEFRKLCDLERHMRVHTGEKPYTCNVCGIGFQQAHNLKKHLIIHTKEKIHQCDVCKKRFGRSDVLNRHMIIHAVVKPFHCAECDKTFGRASQLTSHALKYHPS